MKKIFLLLILIGCCFNTSFAQKEKFFSLEANVGTFASSYMDKFNGNVSIIPYFNINRWKFGLGLSYSHFNYYIHSGLITDHSHIGYSPERLTKEKVNFINLDLIVNFSIIKAKGILFNCFGGIAMSNFVIGKGLLIEYDVNRTPNKEYSYILERTPKIKDAIGYKGTLGLELSFLLKDNLKINIASYLDIPIYNMEGYYAKITYDEPSEEYVSGIIINKSSPNLGLGFSLGVEYMFKKKL